MIEKSIIPNKVIINKITLVYFCVIALSSCNHKKDDYKIEYFPTGEIYRTYSINEKKQLNGDYTEFYKNGIIKINTTLINGFFSDSLNYYTDKGVLVAKGVMKNKELRIGWWKELDSVSNQTVFRDYSIVDNKNYISQELYLNEKSDTIFSKSSFFRLDFKNTLVKGKNLARLKYYNDDSTKKSDMSLFINNSSSKENDTLVFNDENICYFPYNFNPKDSLLNIYISKSIYYEDQQELEVEIFNLIFKLKLDESTFYGSSGDDSQMAPE